MTPSVWASFHSTNMGMGFISAIWEWVNVIQMGKRILLKCPLLTQRCNLSFPNIAPMIQASGTETTFCNLLTDSITVRMFWPVAVTSLASWWDFSRFCQFGFSCLSWGVSVVYSRISVSSLRNFSEWSKVGVLSVFSSPVWVGGRCWFHSDMKLSFSNDNKMEKLFDEAMKHTSNSL